MSPLPISARSQYVICLAGHIDHGKSAIVQALTGGKVDRLPEEKRRGITIELGFAHFDANGARFALIDVPGHERFVHTMVAGASGVDAALLVVAADDSVMPQTREHLALLELLGVQRGVIAVSKCDLADEEQLQLVEMEMDELVGGTFLMKAPRIRVSAHTGLGIERLKEVLIDCATTSSGRATTDPRFRLPIDRSFSPAGQGAVVTGTVWRGATKVGDTLELQPAGEMVRIRKLQAQGKDVGCVSAGERAAINLVGIKASAIRRGDELITPGTVKAGRRHLVGLRILADAAQGLKHRQLVRFHLAASQSTAQVLMSEREVLAGQAAFALIRCASPMLAEYGQPFVLRQLSPPGTIGGGRIIGPALAPAQRLKRCLAAASGLSSAEPAARLEAFIELQREAALDENSESLIGLSPAECQAAIERLVAENRIIRTFGSQPHYFTAQRFRKLKEKLLRTTHEELERRKPASQLPLAVVLSAMSQRASEAVLEAVVADAVAKRELIRRDDRVGLPSGAELSQRQRQLLAALLAQFTAAGPAPPTLKELAEQHKVVLRDLEQLVQVGIDESQLIKLSPQMAIDIHALESLRQSLVEYFQRQPTAKVGELREQWKITRKHAVPIFEYFDECKITVRAGDLRSAGPRLSFPIGEAKL
ncbi:MAG TPA: selenocysteine-specific translation elongation factor [Pirellulaceae bacterium]|jgi:selenocysteine-specific elongation factor